MLEDDCLTSCVIDLFYTGVEALYDRPPLRGVRGTCAEIHREHYGRLDFKILISRLLQEIAPYI